MSGAAAGSRGSRASVQVHVGAYEHPETLKDRAWLTSGGDYFPHTASPGHRDRVDFDHHGTSPIPAELGERLLAQTTNVAPVAASSIGPS